MAKKKVEKTFAVKRAKEYLEKTKEELKKNPTPLNFAKMKDAEKYLEQCQEL